MGQKNFEYVHISDSVIDYAQNKFSFSNRQLSIAEAKFILGIIYNTVRNVYVFEVFLAHIFRIGTEYGEILRTLFTQCKL